MAEVSKRTSSSSHLGRDASTIVDRERESTPQHIRDLHAAARGSHRTDCTDRQVRRQVTAHAPHAIGSRRRPEFRSLRVAIALQPPRALPNATHRDHNHIASHSPLHAHAHSTHRAPHRRSSMSRQVAPPSSGYAQAPLAVRRQEARATSHYPKVRDATSWKWRSLACTPKARPDSTRTQRRPGEA